MPLLGRIDNEIMILFSGRARRKIEVRVTESIRGIFMYIKKSVGTKNSVGPGIGTQNKPVEE